MLLYKIWNEQTCDFGFCLVADTVLMLIARQITRAVIHMNEQIFWNGKHNVTKMVRQWQFVLMLANSKYILSVTDKEDSSCKYALGLPGSKVDRYGTWILYCCRNVSRGLTFVAGSMLKFLNTVFFIRQWTLHFVFKTPISYDIISVTAKCNQACY